MTRSIFILFVVAALIAHVSGAGNEDVFEILPEIHHVFRQPEVMPSAWFSKLFGLIALAPWALLISGWIGLGITPTKVVSSLSNGPSMGSVSVVAFLLSLASIEYLLFLYWVKFNIFQTLGYLFFLSIVAAATGQRALSQIQKIRTSS
ncbi:Dolichyl-diphosphooligosaccharide--protein glycosyltransferase subunit Swp1 [Phycomyces nitens]|nr:Dolichyl-diphosphooligosaccharide--protein glycosyltransferase subunit Swp1 [Phycomyces nitens]